MVASYLEVFSLASSGRSFSHSRLLKSGSPRTEELYKVLCPTPPCHHVTRKPIGTPWANVFPKSPPNFSKHSYAAV